MVKAFNKNLALLLGGQFISQIGDKFYALALAFWVLQATGSPAQMGIVLFSSMVPSIVLGFFIGGIIDKYNRKAILVAADILRAVVVSAVVVIYYTGHMSVAVIVTAQVLLSVASAFFNPAVLATMPQIVPGERLVKANSTSQFLAGTANILGPVLGGLAVSGLGYAFVFVFNALSFIIAAVCEALMQLPPMPEAPVAKQRARETLKEGYSYIFARKQLMVLLGVVAVIHFFVGSVQVIMPVLAKSLPGEGAANLGYIESAFGFGIVAMALILHAANLKVKEEGGMFLGIVALGAVMAASGALTLLGVQLVSPYLAAYFMLSASVILVSTNYTVILQRTIDNAMAGRVFGIVGSVGNFSLPIAILVFGCIIEKVSIGTIAAFCGAAILLISAVLIIAYRAQKIPLPKREEG